MAMDPTRFLASVYRARVTLGAAISQMQPADDKIICDRVREAHETLRTVLEIARQDCPREWSAALDIACAEIAEPADPLARCQSDTLTGLDNFLTRHGYAAVPHVRGK